MLGGCGGSADSTPSAQPSQAGTPTHAVPLERPPGQPTDRGFAKRQARASSQPKQQSPPGSQGATKPHSATPHQASPAEQQSEDAVAKVKELIGSNGGSKQRTVSTPKQIREVLQELHDQSGGQASSGDESGGGNSPSGVEEVLESLAGN